MEIKTKFDVEDKCYFFDDDGKLIYEEVHSINIECRNRGEVTIKYWFHPTDFIQREEEVLYATKEELLSSLNGK